MILCSLVACIHPAVARFVYIRGRVVVYPAVCRVHMGDVARCGYQLVALTHRPGVVA